LQAKGKSGNFVFPLRSLTSENIKGVSIKIRIRNGNLEQAFPIVQGLD